MTDDVYFGELPGSLVQPESNLFLSQDRNAQNGDTHDLNVPVKIAHHGQKAVTEMIVGAWYLDEFGNPTREIRARD